VDTLTPPPPEDGGKRKINKRTVRQNAKKESGYKQRGEKYS
jgi:hypothetical protein